MDAEVMGNNKGVPHSQGQQRQQQLRPSPPGSGGSGGIVRFGAGNTVHVWGEKVRGNYGWIHRSRVCRHCPSLSPCLRPLVLLPTKTR